MRFDEFSETLERNCHNGWRSVIGRDNEDIIESVNSIIFTRKESEEEWVFTFGLRVGDRWHQAKETIEPIEYDILNPPPIDGAYDPKQSMSPDNVASDVALKLLTEVAEEVSNGDR